jgi:two-component system, chemotaxis family, CheB/CheR fusion protein
MNEDHELESIQSDGEPPSIQEQTAVPAVAVVGIGASAGGLQACRHLLADLPADTGLAIVLIQHLDPTHESSLTGILGRVTTMPVTEATDGVPESPTTYMSYRATPSLPSRIGR